MKTMITLLTLITSPAFAQGDRPGGGGDTKTELRIKEIRNNILGWINAGRAKKLSFSEGITYERYINGDGKNLGMIELLQEGRVIVNSIAEAQEDQSDEELNTRVDGQPKVCKGFLSKKDSKLHILCNVERFENLNPQEQYQQVHHEYAGLGLIEKNTGADSDYEISRQLTDKGEYKTVWMLPVEPEPNSPDTEYAKCLLMKESDVVAILITRAGSANQTNVAETPSENRKIRVSYLDGQLDFLTTLTSTDDGFIPQSRAFKVPLTKNEKVSIELKATFPRLRLNCETYPVIHPLQVEFRGPGNPLTASAPNEKVVEVVTYGYGNWDAGQTLTTSIRRFGLEESWNQSKISGFEIYGEAEVKRFQPTKIVVGNCVSNAGYYGNNASNPYHTFTCQLLLRK